VSGRMGAAKVQQLVLTCVLLVAGMACGGARAGTEDPVRPVDTPLADGRGDEAVYRKIAEVRELAEKIVIDGKGGDWEGIPAQKTGRPVGDRPSEQVVWAAVAPREKELLIAAGTAKKPSQAAGTFWFGIDCCGESSVDVDISLTTTFTRFEVDQVRCRVRAPDGEVVSSRMVAGVQVAIGEVIEVRVPYSVLRGLVPPESAAEVETPALRPWVRVRSFSRDTGNQRWVLGPAAASFRLVAERYPLDSPLRRPGKSPRAVRMPVRDKWFIFQGEYASRTHSASWGYDLGRHDADHSPYQREFERKREESYSWDQEVIAPEAARVTAMRNDSPDEPVTEKIPTAAESKLANGVNLMIGRELLGLYHFRQDSVKVTRDAMVTPGTPLGRIGNSGRTAGPHLHVSLSSWDNTIRRWTTQPLSLASVRVSLNYAPDDPWARDFTAWTAREGYFVEGLPS
jgi:hypothetical protein